MSPITAQDAYAQTDPNATEEQRLEAASNIIAGVAANDAYWNSRPDLEALRAAHEGHGVVVRDGSADANPTGSVTTTDKAAAIDATAEEVPATAVAAGDSAKPAETDAAAAAKLREQLTAAGITPEA